MPIYAIATQLHLHRDMHFLQSERVGFPPSQSHLVIHLDLELPPHKHRAMQCRSGTQVGQPYFIWSRTQSLHPPPSDGLVPPDPFVPFPPEEQLASAGEIMKENMSNTINTAGNANPFFSSISSKQKGQVLACISCNPFHFFYTLLGD